MNMQLMSELTQLSMVLNEGPPAHKNEQIEVKEKTARSPQTESWLQKISGLFALRTIQKDSV